LNAGSLSQSEATCPCAGVPIANLLILLAFTIRNQQVAGSTPAGGSIKSII
jgi:hypothetical protein